MRRNYSVNEKQESYNEDTSIRKSEHRVQGVVERQILRMDLRLCQCARWQTIACKGTYHYRSGSTKQELRGTALQQFILKKMGRSWDDISNDRASVDDMDRKAIDYFLRKGIEAQRIPEDQREASTKDILDSLGLIDNDGLLKNAAILLFGKNPLRFFPSIAFKIGRFGKNEADLMFQDVIEGNIIQMADRVM